jgi:hypothetical protein
MTAKMEIGLPRFIQPPLAQLPTRLRLLQTAALMQAPELLRRMPPGMESIRGKEEWTELTAAAVVVAVVELFPPFHLFRGRSQTGRRRFSPMASHFWRPIATTATIRATTVVIKVTTKALTTVAGAVPTVTVVT